MDEGRNEFERIAEASERAQGENRSLRGGLETNTPVGRMIAWRLALLGATLVAVAVATVALALM